jgi:tRNA(fMet)-specific endonuclease VapC
MTNGLLRLPQDAAAPRLVALVQLLQPIQHSPFDRECAAIAARLRVEREAAGTPIGPHDTLIAAVALRHQATLVTRNVREFSRVTGLQWVNWHGTTLH